MDSESDSSSNSDVEQKPKIEDVLFFNDTHCFDEKEKKRYYGKKRYKNAKSQVAETKLTDENLEKMIIDDLNDKHFSGYVKYLKSNYKDCLNKSTKDSLKCIEARIKANELFATTPHSAKIHKDIWELYSKSIAFAPVGSKELVLAYECRSNLLLHLKKYKDCVKDVDRALDMTNFDLLKVKLLCRKMTCFAAMDKDIDEKKKLWTMLDQHLEKIDDVFKDKKFLKMVEQAKNDSCSHPSEKQGVKYSADFSKVLSTFSNKIEMLFNKEIRLVANCDLVPGQMVVATNPLVVSFNPNKFYAYCSHCLSLMWAGIPCDECSLCMYCSEECKTEAWEKYHILECKLLPHINFDNINYNNMHLSVRVFLKAIREFGSIAKLKEKIQEVDKLRSKITHIILESIIPTYFNVLLGLLSYITLLVLTVDGKLSKNLFDSDFLQFYVSSYTEVNGNSYNLHVLTKKAREACFLIPCMIQTCDILKLNNFKSLRGKDLAKDQTIVDFGFVMLKIMIIIHKNAKVATQMYTSHAKCDKYTEITDCDLKRHCVRGTYNADYDGMFEKSCNPNVAVCWTDYGKLIYYCVQPIKKMEKLTISHYTEFFLDARAVRDVNSYLLPHCKCTACSKDWPVMEELYEKHKRRSKMESNEMKIVQKYFERNQSVSICAQEIHCNFSTYEFAQLCQDVEDVVKVCGQPSFGSSLMIHFLCIAYEKKLGTSSLISHVPPNC